MRAPSRRSDRSGAGTPRRMAMVVALLVVAALGSTAREGTRLSTTGILNGRAAPVTVAFGISVIAAACLALAAMTMMLARRRASKFTKAGGPAAARWQRTLAFAAALVVLASLVIGLVEVIRRVHSRRPARVPRPRAPRLVPGDATTLVVVLVALTTAAAVTVAAIWWRRWRKRVSAGHPAGEPDASPLAAAITAGSAALDAIDDARQAIISCYAAMEDALATAGSPRRAADTPEELLGRADRDGTLRTPAAAQLTELFREARFSPHALGDAEHDAAALALGDISRELGGQR
jgi:Domain of unknown function (DUF4129)